MSVRNMGETCCFAYVLPRNDLSFDFILNSERLYTVHNVTIDLLRMTDNPFYLIQDRTIIQVKALNVLATSLMSDCLHQ